MDHTEQHKVGDHHNRNFNYSLFLPAGKALVGHYYLQSDVVCSSHTQCTCCLSAVKIKMRHHYTLFGYECECLSCR